VKDPQEEARRVFVAGGSGVLGQQIVEAFLKSGDSVGLGYLSSNPQDLYLQNGTRQPSLLPVKMDVRSQESVTEALREFCEIFGGIDILVNAAGINLPSDWDEQSDSEWLEILDVNLVGVFRVTKAAVPLMPVNNGANIVNISSVSSQIGGPRTAHYAASKGGVEAFTKVLALNLASKGIRSNAVSPGYIASPMASGAIEDPRVSAVVNRIPMGRKGEAEEVADAVVFVSSSKASYINGQVLGVNGGLSLG
jgi:NAD(P)-dependent dehydrogenase (short-subunit alcohol dehydrogenase family)